MSVYVVIVTVKVKPGAENSAKFVEAIRKNHEATRKEPGNLRFDVVRTATPPAEGEPEVFTLYEVYKKKEDFTSHQQTAHYFAFRDEVADIMAEPRLGLHNISVFPEDWS